SASFSRSPPKSATQTFMPDRANRIAADRPSPDAPPVTTATLLGDMAGCGTRILRRGWMAQLTANYDNATGPLRPNPHGRSSPAVIVPSSLLRNGRTGYMLRIAPE